MTCSDGIDCAVMCNGIKECIMGDDEVPELCGK